MDPLEDLLRSIPNGSGIQFYRMGDVVTVRIVDATGKETARMECPISRVSDTAWMMITRGGSGG